MMKYSFLSIIFILSLSACKKEVSIDIEEELIPELVTYHDSLHYLYYLADETIKKKDTLIVKNTYLDTIVVETGFFTRLQYGYPMFTSSLDIFIKDAIDLEKDGEKKKARLKYREAIDTYKEKMAANSSSNGFTCLNGYYQHHNNTSMLCSFAYNELGQTKKAIKVLQPFLANIEADKTDIHAWYIELCAKVYGEKKVREALNNLHLTLVHKKDAKTLQYDYIVNLFGAEIGVSSSLWTDTLTTIQAKDIIRKSKYFYVLN